MTERLDGWAQRLHAVFAERFAMPYEWGANDCVSFAAACVEAMTGQAPIEVTWHDARTAAEALEEAGGIEAWLDARYERLEPAQAQRGDLGMTEQGERRVLNVCTGTGWAAPSDLGLAETPRDSAVIAWRVAR